MCFIWSSSMRRWGKSGWTSMRKWEKISLMQIGKKEMTKMMLMERVNLCEWEMWKRMENKEKSEKRKRKKEKERNLDLAGTLDGRSTQSVLGLRWVYAAGTRATTVIKWESAYGQSWICPVLVLRWIVGGGTNRTIGLRRRYECERWPTDHRNYVVPSLRYGP